MFHGSHSMTTNWMNGSKSCNQLRIKFYHCKHSKQIKLKSNINFEFIRIFLHKEHVFVSLIQLTDSIVLCVKSRGEQFWREDVYFLFERMYFLATTCSNKDNFMCVCTKTPMEIDEGRIRNDAKKKLLIPFCVYYFQWSECVSLKALRCSAKNAW